VAGIALFFLYGAVMIVITINASKKKKERLSIMVKIATSYLQVFLTVLIFPTEIVRIRTEIVLAVFVFRTEIVLAVLIFLTENGSYCFDISY
jgi:hypothetical protein